MSVSLHEIRYMPKYWSKRFKPAELVDEFFHYGFNITKEVRRTTRNELDIPYDFGKRTKYDIYGTNLPKDAPLMVFLHGGYWKESSKDVSGYAVPSFVAQGIRVIVAGYDLCPDVTLTEIVRQVKVLASKVLEQAHSWGSKCVWFVGHSAGAHLFSCLLNDRAWFELNSGLRPEHLALLRGVVLVSGLYEIEPVLRTSNQETLKLTKEEVSNFSFCPHDESEEVDQDTLDYAQHIKIILVAADSESPAFIEDSRRYARRLIKLIDRVEFLLVRDNYDHFNVVEDLTKNDYVLTRLIINNIESTKNWSKAEKKSCN
ncbi:hypothetical protein TKK_0005665 [Trichogramma kaykai]|uniref:BD-FAE-like domain-containing protein n=1 Tax=Trichogramma kaykai TaxID=54128 RepID=A0ABD2XGF3_9HYME